MPTYTVTAPNGSSYTVTAPEGATEQQVLAYVQRHVAESEKQVGFFGAAKEAALTLPRKGLEAAEFAFGTSPETREALIKAGTPEGQYTNFADINDVGSFVDWAKQTAGSTVGYMTAPAVAAGAAMALPEVLGGAALAGTVGTGVLGAQYLTDNLSRQAETQQAAIERGEAPEETSLGEAALAAAGQTTLDVVGLKFFKPVFKAFPAVGKLLGTEGEEVSAQTVKDLVEGYKANKFTVKNGIVTGMAKGAAFEIPQEIAQQALERWQAGLSLTDKDAQDEFVAVAAGAALGGSVLGSVTGVSKNAKSRQMAETILSDYQARQGEADVAGQRAERVEQPEVGAGGAGVSPSVQPGEADGRVPEEPVTTAVGRTSPDTERVDVGAPPPAGSLDLKYQRGEQEEKSVAPHTLYHGTTAKEDFPSFKTVGKENTLSTILGTHFAADPEISNSFAARNLEEGDKRRYTQENLAENGRVIPARVNIKNPLDLRGMTEEGDDATVAKAVISQSLTPEYLSATLHAFNIPLTVDGAKNVMREWDAGNSVNLAGISNFDKSYFLNNFTEGTRGLKEMAPYGVQYGTTWRKAAEDMVQKFQKESGYDSIIYTNTSDYESDTAKNKDNYIVFNPDNIKFKLSHEPSELKFQRGEAATDVDSTGKPVHPTPEGRANFRQWFGQSKAADAEGRPVQYYTGTSKDVDFASFNVGRHGVWFTTSPAEASAYAKENDSQKTKYENRQFVDVNTASRVIPAYLRAENPYTGEAPVSVRKAQNYKKAQSDWFDTLRAQGYDSWIPESGTGKYKLAVILKDPTQIKASYGNTGGFSPTEKNIAFRRGAEEGAVSLESAQRIVKDLTKGWRNAPNVRVYDSVKDLPAEYRGVFPDTKGFYDPRTKTVHIIAGNAASEASLKGTVFHESLGHYGLKEKFGASLNNVLGDVYRTNAAMRKAADAWLKLNPDTYANLTPNQQRINAVEEVLAERSEAGPLKGAVQTAFAKIASVIRQFLRQMGLVRNYSDADVQEILRQAHGAVISSPEGLPAQRHEASVMFQRAMGVIDNQPKFDKTLIDKFLNKLSAMPSPAQEQFFRMSSLNQLRDMAEAINPRFGAIAERINKSIGNRDNDLTVGRQTIERNLHKWSEAVRKFPPLLRDKFYAVANDTTIYQIDPLDQATQDLLKKPYSSLSQEDQQAVDLVREYNALDPKLKQIYRDMRQAYKDESDRFFAMMAKVVNKSTYKKITDRYNSKRLKVYLPLIRSGDYWMTYQDQNNDTQTLAYDSPRERDLAAKEIEQRLGLRPNDIQKFSRLDIKGVSKTAPPTGFLADVVKELTTGGVDPAIIDTVYESFLNYLPTQSARQMFRKRSEEPPRGFMQNPINAYATAASRLNSHIINAEYATVLGNHLNDLMAQIGVKTENQINNGLYKAMKEQIETALNPSYSTMDKVGSGVYYWTMAGNVSTALMNIFTLPMVTGPVLAGKYGTMKSMKAMTDAFGTIFKGGFDDNTEFLPDFTFGKNATGELAQLYKELVSRAVIRRSTGYDIKEAQKVDIDDYSGKWTKVKRLLGYGMHNMERFTREATAIAAFKLARESGKNVKTSINEAIRVVEDTHGTAIAEAGPAMFKSGIGRMAYMLKRFPHTMLWLQAKLFKQAFAGQDADVKRIARRQLIRMYGSALLFAGVQGLPTMGALNVLASMLNGIFGDDDEPYDVDEQLRDIFGTTLYTGLMNDVLGLDFASRTSLSDLIWRDDPRHLAQVGPVAYVTEKFLGPSASLAMNINRGVGLMNEGQVERGMEAMLPAAFRNMMKSFRYAEEGAKTLDGKPIVSPENISTRDIFAQFLGISPTAITEANVKASSMKQADVFFAARKNALYNRLYAAFMAHDQAGWNETIQEMAAFSRKHPDWAFTPQSIMSSIKTNMQHQRESVNGVFIARKHREGIVTEYGD